MSDWEPSNQTSKHYTSFSNTLDSIATGSIRAVFEKRPEKYMFGSNNYGDIPGLYNRADGDPWDVFAPGYKYRALQIDKPYLIKRVVGYLRLDDGNHKIAVLVHDPSKRFSYKKALREIQEYCAKYVEKVMHKKGLSGTWVALHKDYTTEKILNAQP